MGRNHFSRAGGPYFINNGFSKHTDHDHKSGHNHDDIKPDNVLVVCITIGAVIVLFTIASLLASL